LFYHDKTKEEDLGELDNLDFELPKNHKDSLEKEKSNLKGFLDKGENINDDRK
jgi:hypothetical protein